MTVKSALVAIASALLVATTMSSTSSSPLLTAVTAAEFAPEMADIAKAAQAATEDATFQRDVGDLVGDRHAHDGENVMKKMSHIIPGGGGAGKPPVVKMMTQKSRPEGHAAATVLAAKTAANGGTPPTSNDPEAAAAGVGKERKPHNPGAHSGHTHANRQFSHETVTYKDGSVHLKNHHRGIDFKKHKELQVLEGPHCNSNQECDSDRQYCTVFQVCQPRNELHGRCVQNHHCYHSRCDERTGLCVPLVDINGKCKADEECVRPLVCSPVVWEAEEPSKMTAAARTHKSHRCRKTRLTKTPTYSQTHIHVRDEPDAGDFIVETMLGVMALLGCVAGVFYVKVRAKRKEKQ